MAATSNYIKDYAGAIASGVIPGTFSDDRTEFIFPELSTEGHNGSRLFWSLRVALYQIGANGLKKVPMEDWMLDKSRDMNGRYKCLIIVASRKGDGGKVRDIQPTEIITGKQNTNVLTQALRDALSRFNKQSKTYGDDGNGDGNTGNGDSLPKARPLPMLVQDMGKTKDANLTAEDFKKGVTAQVKLNGVRSIVRLTTDHAVEIYSRSGKLYHKHEHIRDELKPILEKRPDLYIDGETYEHGKSLQSIAGQARRDKSETTEEQCFYTFDIFSANGIANGNNPPSKLRQAMLSKVLYEGNGGDKGHIIESDDGFFRIYANLPHIRQVMNFKVNNMNELTALYEKALECGYEGIIARKDDAPYQYSYKNYHSNGLIKIKPVHDAEFPCVGYTQGTTGKDLGAVIWVCAVGRTNIVDEDNDDPRHDGDRSRHDRSRHNGDDSDDIPVLHKPNGASTFNVVPNMKLPMRKVVFEMLGRRVGGQTLFEKYIKYKPLTVQYRDLSETGVPMQAKAIAFRTYEGETDPVAEFMALCEKNHPDADAE